MTPEASTWSQRDVVATGGFAAIFVVFMAQAFWDQDPVDMFPTLAVAHFYNLGEYNQIYGSGSVFTLSNTPSDWRAYFDLRFGEDSACFPFLYAPLWAWLVAKLVPLGSEEFWLHLPYAVNPVLAVGCSWCTWRTVGQQVNPLVWFASSVGLLTLTTPLYATLQVGQAQVLVTILILAAVERSHAKDGRAAGALLAVAASIKIYPMFFVAIWLGRRDWRAVRWFTGIGATLGGGSLVVAGWPLHLAFLDNVRAISHTIYHHPFNLSIEVTLASALHQLGFEGLAPDNPDVLRALAKPAWLTWLGRAGLLGVVAGVGLVAERVSERDLYERVWPVALLLLALAGPLAWVYYLLAGLFFLPLLFQNRTTGVMALGLWLVISPFGVLIRMVGASRLQAASVTLATLGFAALYAFRSRKEQS